MKRIFLIFCFFPIYLFANLIVHSQIKEPISPATALHVDNTLSYALTHSAKLVLFSIDTPGGLLSSTHAITKSIASSKIPVAVYVEPKGAHAASAGTYILYSAHVAAMAPGTNIGAATPISLISQDHNKTSTLNIKILEDAAASLRSHAKIHDRNATWAEKAVYDGSSIDASQALSFGVIEFIAEDTLDLLEKLEGHKIHMEKNLTTPLLLSPFQIKEFKQDTKTKLLSAIANPNLAYIFVLLALYGIFFELLNPGAIFPGVLGGISGLIALYSLHILPFNHVGLLLILLGVMLMVAEVFIAGFGILGLGGVVAFSLGSLMLFDPQVIGSDIALPLIIALSLVSSGFFIFLLGFIYKTRKKPSIVGGKSPLNAEVEVVRKTDTGYKVLFQGELWNASSTKPLSLGEHATVENIKGLHLYLKPKE